MKLGFAGSNGIFPAFSDQPEIELRKILYRDGLLCLLFFHLVNVCLGIFCVQGGLYFVVSIYACNVGKGRGGGGDGAVVIVVVVIVVYCRGCILFYCSRYILFYCVFFLLFYCVES